MNLAFAGASRPSIGLISMAQKSFQRASAWNTNQSYLQRSHPQRQQTPHRFKKVTPKNRVRFQLWSEQQQQWSKRINSPPKILSERDITNWQHFKVTLVA